jgi:hypothetical protein
MPRVIKSPCYHDVGSSVAWGAYVERCDINWVEGSPARHATTVLYKSTGEEVTVLRVINFGTTYVRFLCNAASSCASALYTTGDTIKVRYPSPIQPRSVFPNTNTPCAIGLGVPPSMPPF